MLLLVCCDLQFGKQVSQSWLDRAPGPPSAAAQHSTASPSCASPLPAPAQQCPRVANRCPLRHLAQDPYVIIKVGSQSFRTKTHTDGGKNPGDQRRRAMTCSLA
jgi:hypothetical protein